MTDTAWMEADCIHGEVWYDCQTCEAEMQLDRLQEDIEYHALSEGDPF